MSTVTEYSVWLMPCAAEQIALQALVNQLAEENGSACFMPHLTIQGDISLPLKQLQIHVAELASQMSPQTWPVKEVDTTDYFFRCLFLRYDEMAVYSELKKSLYTLTATELGLSLFPHISLAYGLNDKQRQIMRSHLQASWSPRTTQFDRLVIAHSSQHVAIEDWEILSEYPLQDSTR